MKPNKEVTRIRDCIDYITDKYEDPKDREEWGIFYYYSKDDNLVPRFDVFLTNDGKAENREGNPVQFKRSTVKELIDSLEEKIKKKAVVQQGLF